MKKTTKYILAAIAAIIIIIIIIIVANRGGSSLANNADFAISLKNPTVNAETKETEGTLVITDKATKAELEVADQFSLGADSSVTTIVDATGNKFAVFATGSDTTKVTIFANVAEGKTIQFNAINPESTMVVKNNSAEEFALFTTPSKNAQPWNSGFMNNVLAIKLSDFSRTTLGSANESTTFAISTDKSSLEKTQWAPAALIDLEKGYDYGVTNTVGLLADLLS